MEHRSIETSGMARAAWRTDLLLALCVAALLTLGWTVTDWAQVGALNLPDTDDMMRLAQIRDWIAGQRFDDWTQYRLAPPAGAPMHWSRLNDLAPGAIIVALTPAIGRHAAEVAAVIAYPAALFVASLMLAARIGRRVWGRDAAAPALLLTALAYPGNALFLPGRIDHHALQAVMLQAALLAALARPTLRNGVVTGTAVALSFGIGLEAAPQVAALLLVLFGRWVAEGARQRRPVTGVAAGLALATLLLLAFARPSYWSGAMCDTFTPATVSGTLAVALAWGLLALITPQLTDWRTRLSAGAALGVVAGGATLIAFPACLAGPYSAMGPFLERAIIDNISEANSVFHLPRLSDMLSILGVLGVANGVAAWAMRSRAARPVAVLPLAAILFASLLLTFVQVRGAYLGAALAGPMLAGLVVAARRASRRRELLLIAAWIGSAGMIWLEVPPRLAGMLGERAGGQVHGPAAVVASRRACRSSTALAAIDRLPPGSVMAAIDLGAYLVGATRHGVVGAGYHRNQAGNTALYDFFLSPPERAHRIATAWNVRYVAWCPGDFDEIDVALRYPASLAAGLRRDETPMWLTRVPLRDTSLRFYRVAR